MDGNTLPSRPDSRGYPNTNNSKTDPEIGENTQAGLYSRPREYSTATDTEPTNPFPDGKPLYPEQLIPYRLQNLLNRLRGTPHPGTTFLSSACPIYKVLRRRHTLLLGHPVFNSYSSTTPKRELN